jgi:fermentation-respiration switch protein FrsA (DUF1100 family)
MMTGRPPRSLTRRILVRIVRLPVILYIALLLFGWLGSEDMIFVPQPASYRDDDRVVKIEVCGGERISATYVTNPAARATLLFSHGNAEDIGDLRFLLTDLAAAGYNVLAYDYRGYGTSDGRPSEDAAYRDIEAAYAYLTNTLHVAPSNIIVYGRSVGSGPSVDLASRRPVAGLVLQSGFTSAFRVMTHVKIAPFDRFDNLAKIPRVKCPILLFHGTEDTVIPPWHSERLEAAATAPVKRVPIPGAGHNDLVDVAGPLFSRELAAFVATCVGEGRGPIPGATGAK